MKKLVLLSAMLALVFSFNAKAFEINPYASGKVNFNLYKTEITDYSNAKDNVFGGSIAVGVFGDESLPVRAEFEFSMSAKAKDKITDIDAWTEDATIETMSYMANFYYDFYNSTSFVPYAGFGLGATTIKVNSKDEDGEKFLDAEGTKFSWQVGLGSYYKVTENLLADLGVKYSQLSSISDYGIDIDTNITTISLGLRYNF